METAETTPRIFCIGTHHKTGTVWMRRVFREISRALDIQFLPLHRKIKWKAIPEEGRVICVNWGSRFATELFDRNDARFLHIIRDPRDVLLSGARYHETTKAPTEKFLYKPRRDLGGKTYQEHIHALPSLQEKLAFEMDETHRLTLAEMLDWPYGHPRVMDFRYEDLIVDTECEKFAEVLRFFGFSDEEVSVGKKIFYDNSIFGGLAGDQATGRAKTHVVSGKPAQWLQKLPPETASLYLEKYGDDLIALGYETDKSWLDRLGSELVETGS